MIKKDFSTFLLTVKPRVRFHKSSIPAWINVAIAEIGQAEISGREDNPRIVEYLRTVDLETPEHRIDEIAWCSAFVNWVMLKCGYEPTRKALAKSWLDWGVELPDPIFGCIGVFDRGNKSWMGHVGFVMDITPTSVYLLGGNQNNRVSIRSYTRSKLKALKWPK